jgi:hypothetical protein
LIFAIVISPQKIKVKGSGTVIRLQSIVTDTIREVHLQENGDSASSLMDLCWVNTIWQVLSRYASLFASRYPNLKDALAHLLTINDQYTGESSIGFGWTVAVENPGAALEKAIEALTCRLAPNASGQRKTETLLDRPRIHPSSKWGLPRLGEGLL